MTTTGTTAARRLHRAAGVAAVIIGVTLAATGCGGEPHKPAASSSAPPPPPPPVVHSTASLVRLQGKLTDARKQALVANVAKTVDAWLQPAYVGGTFPRAASTYTPTIFAGWRGGAITKASTQLGMLSNSAISAEIDGVKVVSSGIGIDALAAGGYVAGVTARIKLVLDTSGQHAVRETVTGRLAMTPEGTHWTVFSFDIARTEAPIPGAPASSPAAKPSASASPTGGKS